MKKYLIFIPARSGSKSLKNKNLTILKKKPLIFYTLKIAIELKKKINSEIFLSTDSKRIFNYSNKIVKLQKYLRPKNISSDSSNIIEAVIHCINYYKKQNQSFDSIILLQPTSPIRQIKELLDAIKMYEKKKLKSLMSVSNVKEHPNEIIKLNNQKSKKWSYIVNFSKNIYQRQQYCNNFFFIDGNFYISKVAFLKKHNTFLKRNITMPFITNKCWSIDINTEEDLKVAESII